MNWTGIMAIYLHEMDRMRRTTVQSIFSPVISSSLYFVVFGAAIGSRIPVIEDISYGSFIVPGMIMLANIIIPGTMKEPYEISSITGMRLPIAAPKTTK